MSRVRGNTDTVHTDLYHDTFLAQTASPIPALMYISNVVSTFDRNSTIQKPIKFGSHLLQNGNEIITNEEKRKMLDLGRNPFNSRHHRIFMPR